MPKSYVAETKLSPKQIKQLQNGKSCTVCKNDLIKDENTLHQISFAKLKDLNRYKKSMVSGKGFRLNPTRMEISTMDGGSMLPLGGSMLPLGKGVKGGKVDILNSIKNIGHSAGEAFKIPGTKVSANPFDAGYMLGHDVIAPELKKAGAGLKKKCKKKTAGGKVKKGGKLNLNLNVKPHPISVVHKPLELPDNISVKLPVPEVSQLPVKPLMPKMIVGKGFIGIGGSNSAFFTNQQDKMGWVRSHRQTVSGSGFAPL